MIKTIAFVTLPVKCVTSCQLLVCKPASCRSFLHSFWNKHYLLLFRTYLRQLETVYASRFCMMHTSRGARDGRSLIPRYTLPAAEFSIHPGDLQKRRTTYTFKFDFALTHSDTVKTGFIELSADKCCYLFFGRFSYSYYPFLLRPIFIYSRSLLYLNLSVIPIRS